MNAWINPTWREVSKESLLEYLKTCPDYERDAYWNGCFYQFKIGRRQFAIEMDDGRILADPELLR